MNRKSRNHGSEDTINEKKPNMRVDIGLYVREYSLKTNPPSPKRSFR